MKIKFSAPSLPRTGPLGVGVLSGGKLLATAERVDKATDGAIGRAMRASRFNGEKGQSLTVIAPSGVGASRIILLGLGEAIPGMIASVSSVTGWSPLYGDGKAAERIAASLGR